MSSLSSLRATAPRPGRLVATADKGTTMATSKKDGTSQPNRSRKAPKKSASQAASRSATKRGIATPKRAQPKATAGSRSPPSPRLFRKSPILRRIAYGSTLDLRCVAVAVHDTSPLRLSLAGAEQFAEPDGLARDPRNNTYLAAGPRGDGGGPQGGRERAGEAAGRRAGTTQPNAGRPGRRVGGRKSWR